MANPSSWAPGKAHPIFTACVLIAMAVAVFLLWALAATTLPRQGP